jgi:hypothetical protein
MRSDHRPHTLVEGRLAQVKRIYYFSAGVLVGVVATRRTRRAKEAAKAAMKASLTPSAIAADLADAIAELGNAVGSFAADVQQGAANRRASYRPMIDGATGTVLMVSPEDASQIAEQQARGARLVDAAEDARNEVRAAEGRLPRSA